MENWIFFFFFFFTIIVRLFLHTDRILKFLLYLEVYSVFAVLFFVINLGGFDYSVILKVLILIACERALGLSILVAVVRNFRIDKIMSRSLKKCEGF